MPEPTPASLCPACGAANQCAMASDPAAQHCWCMQNNTFLPLPDRTAESCYCPSCLQKILRKQQGLQLLI